MAHVAFQDTPKFAYLRHRPFLVIEMFKTVANAKAHDRTRTERKGWMNDPRSVDIEEVPTVVDSVKDRHMRGATIIIDILHDCIIKNRLQESNEDVLEHFKRKYTNVIERGKNMWAQDERDTLTKSRVQSVPKFDPRGQQHHQIVDSHTPDAARVVSRKV